MLRCHSQLSRCLQGRIANVIFNSLALRMKHWHKDNEWLTLHSPTKASDWLNTTACRRTRDSIWIRGGSAEDATSSHMVQRLCPFMLVMRELSTITNKAVSGIYRRLIYSSTEKSRYLFDRQDIFDAENQPPRVRAAWSYAKLPHPNRHQTSGSHTWGKRRSPSRKI